MSPKLQFSVRTLLLIVVGAATALGLVAVPLNRNAQFWSLRDHGHVILEGFEQMRPAYINPKRWQAAVILVNTAWANVAFHPNYVDNKTLSGAVMELESLASDSRPENAEQKLYQVMDLLEKMRPKSKNYIDGMRNLLQEDLSPSSSQGSGFVPGLL